MAFIFGVKASDGEDTGKRNIEKEALIRNLSRNSKELMGKTCWKTLRAGRTDR